MRKRGGCGCGQVAFVKTTGVVSPMGVRNMETVNERAKKLVHDRAHDLLWTVMGTERNVTEAQLRAQVWRTREGTALRDLMRVYGDRPADTVTTAVAKAGHTEVLSEGLAVLRGGLPAS